MPKPHSLTPWRAPRRSQELRTSSMNTSSLPTMAPSNNRKRSSPMKPQPNTRRQPYRLPRRRPSLLHPQPSYNKLLPLTRRGTSPSRRQPLCHKPQPRRLTQQHRSKQDLQCLPHCPVHSRHLRWSPKQHQSLLSTIHMDKNKQTHWLQPSDDEMDPTASACTGQPLPPATRPTRPPGSDVWWVAEPIINPNSPRHQPKPSGSGWVSWDGSWWRNYWHSHGNSVPEEATRACPEERTYSHDPAFWYNSRVWVHPYRREHDAFRRRRSQSPRQPSRPHQPCQRLQPRSHQLTHSSAVQRSSSGESLRSRQPQALTSQARQSLLACTTCETNRRP